MALVAVPNVSEGRDPLRIAGLVRAVARAGARILDVHSDPHHHRTVLTITGTGLELAEAAAALAEACKELDLTRHRGVHPRLGVLDVYPVVPHGEPMAAAVACARRGGELVHRRTGLPVYFYGDAALRPGTRSLPGLRRGGLQALIGRAPALSPDLGSAIEPRWGVVCVGARPTLVAFNVWVRGESGAVAEVARRVRHSSGGLPGVQALALTIEPPDRHQVSLNLVDPATTGIDAAFEAVARAAAGTGVRIVATEIVGLPPRAYLPAPDAPAARLLVSPGRCLEEVL